MERVAAILDRAAERHGGKKALESMMPRIRSARALSATNNNRWLAEMTRCIFQAGFVWRVVDRKWDDFEDVFFGFPPDRIVMLSPEQLDRFAQNPKIIRNRQKVLTVQHNARFILDIDDHSGQLGDPFQQFFLLEAQRVLIRYLEQTAPYFTPFPVDTSYRHADL